MVIEQKGDGLSHSEAKAIIRTHTQLLYEWATKAPSADVTPELHEALLAVAMRIVEIIENYNVSPPRPKVPTCH